MSYANLFSVKGNLKLQLMHIESKKMLQKQQEPGVLKFNVIPKRISIINFFSFGGEKVLRYQEITATNY